MRKIKKWLVGVLSTVGAVCIALIVCASVLLTYFQITIDKYFLGQGGDFSEYDDTAARAVCEEIEEEAQVLLKNENNILPFTASAASPKKVSMFGVGSAHMKYAGSGSGGGNATGADTLYDALVKNNILPCDDLYKFYESKGTTGNTGGFENIGTEIGSPEVHIDGVSAAVKATAKEWSDTAIYVLSRIGGEESEITANLLCLTNYEERTLDYIVQNYEHVIVLLNTSNQMELGFIDGKGVSRNTGENFSKYAGKIEAALWVGIPGYTGANAIASVLAGIVNPSGRFSDTYAYDVDSAPSVEAVGNAEGIFAGYRWFETAAYEEVIDYDDYERNTTAAYTSKQIATGVQYPFGYGTSYTTFSKEIVEDGTTATGVAFTSADKNAEITVKVKITNVGNVAGKEVVQLYYTAPYNDGGIEKAYVNLAAFEKTNLIQPGESETVTLTFALEDMKSFDYLDANENGISGYELEQGEYLVRVLDNAHDWVNVDEESALCLKYTVSEDIYYDTDSATGKAVTTRFDAYTDGREYISREKKFANLNVNTQENLKNYTYSNPDITTETGNYVKGTDYDVELSKTITLEEMVGVAYDDPKWDTFVSQLSKTEMANLIAMGNFQSQAVERLGIPKTLLFDGPAAIKDTYKSDRGCLLYPSEVTVAATWSKEVVYKFGVSAGDDAKQCGVTGWYAPGVNLHKNAYGSRNFEYFSECPVLSGELAAVEAEGARTQGLIVFVKHLLDGVSSTVNEQSLREIYARPFEIAIKKGDARGLMTSSSLLGTWIGQIKEFLTDIVRTEWGFVGMITSDAASSAMQVQYGIRAGNDIWLATDNSRYTYLIRTEKNIPAMQTACKNILYTISLSENTFVAEVAEATWSPALLIMGLVDGFAALGLCAACYSLVRHLLAVKNENAIKITDKAEGDG